MLLGCGVQLLRSRTRPLTLPITLGPDEAGKNVNIFASTKPTLPFQWWRCRFQVLRFVSVQENGFDNCDNGCDDDGSGVVNTHRDDKHDNEDVNHGGVGNE